MAGDLYIESFSNTHLQVLQTIGASQPQAIYHANRPWNDYQNRLNDPAYGRQGLARDNPNSVAPANRVNLPAHAYINFESANRQAIRTAVAQGNNRQQLAGVLTAVSRPLGLVSNKAALATWNTATGDQRVTMLLNTLDSGTMIIEYYKVGISSVLLVYPNWARHNEP